MGAWTFQPAQPMQPMHPMQQAPNCPAPRRHATPRAKVLGGAAVLLLVGGAAAGGAAFGFAHAGTSSSATGLAGGSGSTSQGRSPRPPSSGGGSQQVPTTPRVPRQGGGGSASRFATPGHATASQSVGIVDIDTQLKYEGARAAGTGMVLTSNGEILTNNHVVEGATKIKVTVVSTGQRYTATVVGTDKVDDVAMLPARERVRASAR